jgi:hypothetical protein
MNGIRPIAIYLPQFHSIIENDNWWGKGFTEWTNVRKSKPLFLGHDQPKIPDDSIGYYDLANPDTLIEQAALAQKYGIYGFAYYHYWFNGKQLLEKPIDIMIKSGKPDFPFCLFWANETWSRRWLGEESEILIKQTYSLEDDIEHIHWLVQAFSDPRNIRIDNRPVFIIYRPADLPNAPKFIEILKSEAVKNGICEPYVIASNSHDDLCDFRKTGFDGILNFEPKLGYLPYFMDDKNNILKLKNNLNMGILSRRLKVYDYAYAKQKMADRTFQYPYFPSSFINFDNSARRNKNGIILKNGNPDLFKKYLIEYIKRMRLMNFSSDENLFFINAWNEWAEGNYLEPDVKNGLAYLETIKEVFENIKNE